MKGRTQGWLGVFAVCLAAVGFGLASLDRITTSSAGQTASVEECRKVVGGTCYASGSLQSVCTGIVCDFGRPVVESDPGAPSKSVSCNCGKTYSALDSGNCDQGG
jgi:uncharacterized membrane protein (DUF4010 family)